MGPSGTKRSPAAAAILFGLVVSSPPLAETQRAIEPPVRSGPPSWVADAVFYEVFPERFRNGDPRNDPKPNDLRGAWPQEAVRGWQVTPWTADWYRLQPWEKATGKDFYWNAQTRRYGGDLQGLLERLDYLHSLGVNAICLNPIFEAPSIHKYDPSYLHHVDNNFGPDPEGDRVIWATENPSDPATWKWTSADRLFLRLVQECHRRQIKVVLDGTFNRVGATFWAFRDVRARGASSRYAGWFAIKAFDDPKTPADEFDYQGFGGLRELPELRTEGGTLAAPVRDHLRAVVRRWGDPNGDGDPSDGIDGWRLDAADRVPHGFWKEFRRSVLAINHEAFLVGEVFWEDWDFNKMWDPAPWLKGDELDAVMNYRLAAAARAFFLDRQNAIAASELDARLAALAPARRETALAMLNLLDTHDTDRLASQAVNPDLADDEGLVRGRGNRGLHDLDRTAIGRRRAATGPRDHELQVVRRRGRREALVLEPGHDDLFPRREVAGDGEGERLAPVLVAHRGGDPARRGPGERGRGEGGVPRHVERRGDADAEPLRRGDRRDRGVGDRDRGDRGGRLGDDEHLVRRRRERGRHDLDGAAVSGVGGAAGAGDDELQVVRRRRRREARVPEAGDDDLVAPQEVGRDVEDERLARILVGHGR